MKSICFSIFKYIFWKYFYSYLYFLIFFESICVCICTQKSSNIHLCLLFNFIFYLTLLCFFKYSKVLYVINGHNSIEERQYDKKILMVSTKSGKVLGSINLAEDAVKPHDLKLSDDASEIYVANLDNPTKVLKYVLVKYKSKLHSFVKILDFRQIHITF